MDSWKEERTVAYIIIDLQMSSFNLYNHNLFYFLSNKILSVPSRIYMFLSGKNNCQGGADKRTKQEVS